MIKLPPRPERPEFFESEEFRALAQELAEFQFKGGTRKLQRYFPWQERFGPFFEHARDALAGWTSGKCAYTEAMLGDPDSGLPEHARVVLHRPASDAVGLDGEVSADHYWWWIAEWSNWHLASGMVTSVKGNRFPVDGERLEPPPPGWPLEPPAGGETPLLLDPALDDPALFLQFSRRGPVGACDVATGEAWQSRRLPRTRRHPGIHTIMTLDLNSDELVESRRHVARSAMKEFARLADGSSSPEAIPALVSPRQEHAAAVRQAVARELERLRRDLDSERPPEEYATRALIQALPHEFAALIICAPRGPGRFSPRGTVQLAEVAEQLDDDLAAVYLERLGVESGGALQVDPLEEEAAPERRGAEREAAPPGDVAERGDDGAVAPPDVDRPVVDRSAQIKAIHIRNFKAIREVSLDLEGLKSEEHNVRLEPAWRSGEPLLTDARRWWSFLGENGSGKSCLLQAIGLVLSAGRLTSVLAEAGLKWSDLHRRPVHGSDEQVGEGQICLDFTNGATIDLRFDGLAHWWMLHTGAADGTEEVVRSELGEPEVQVFVRGYGATRLLASDRDGQPAPGAANVRIANLLDARAPVIDAQRWLLDVSEDDFNVAATTISDLLQDTRLAEPAGEERAGGAAEAPPQAVRLVLQRDVAAGEVTVEGLPLALVSDGYRAVVAMLCDIMSGLSEGTSSSLRAPGIVLIDEIGSHLHPRWRMSITRKLRRALPQVQFIVSTHEPLCLRGLVAKEVVSVTKHAKHGVMIETVERSPSSYRVDQLLTSEFFGLETTIDPDLERRFHHYYRLLALEERTADQEADLEDQYRYLHEHAQPTLGFTRRDQIISDLVDDLLSADYKKEPENQSREAFVESRRGRREATLQKVRDIWQLRASAHDLGR